MQNCRHVIHIQDYEMNPNRTEDHGNWDGNTTSHPLNARIYCGTVLARYNHKKIYCIEKDNLHRRYHHCFHRLILDHISGMF